MGLSSARISVDRISPAEGEIEIARKRMVARNACKEYGDLGVAIFGSGFFSLGGGSLKPRGEERRRGCRQCCRWMMKVVAEKEPRRCRNGPARKLGRLREIKSTSCLFGGESLFS